MSDVQPLFYSKVLSIKQILVFLQVNASVFQIMVNSKRPIIITLLLLLLVPSGMRAQLKWNIRYQTYIDQYKDLAIEQMMKWSIPASITLAQGLLESSAGNSILATKGNNHFGIKCHGWTGPSMAMDDDDIGECFRVYGNARESYEDHSRFLASGNRYRNLFSLSKNDYRGWAYGLKSAGYATNPAYAKKLIDIIELYKLYRYDRAKSYDHFMSKHNGNDQPAISGTTLHPIHIYNKNYYLKARAGDTFKSIGRELGISYRKLARINERDKRDRLEAGDIIYLKKKRKHAEKQYKHHPHTVRAGESMYSIAQFYGIRLKSLYKMNHMSPDNSIHVGQQLRVY